MTLTADEWFVGAEFEFAVNSQVDGADKIKALLKTRGETQPMGQPSCGSVFKNPSADHAGRLIEEAGLKGHRIGGAVVSTKHANFIINEADASADDIERLITHVRQTVLDQSGVLLETEVRIVGEHAVKSAEVVS